MKYEDAQGIRVSEIRKLATSSYENLLNDYLQQKTSTDSQRIGSAIHSLVLQKEIGEIPENLKILEFDNWKTKEAQNYKKEYDLNNEVIPLLSKEFDTIKNMLKVSSSHLKEIFDNGEFEKAYFGDLDGFGEIKGRVDCLKEDMVVDLKCTTQFGNLDKKIFDMGYQLQMYLYMLLTKTTQARLIFLHPVSGLIEIKKLDFFIIENECDILLKKALSNKSKLDLYIAFNDIEVKNSDYNPPQWALSELIEWEEKQ